MSCPKCGGFVAKDHERGRCLLCGRSSWFWQGKAFDTSSNRFGAQGPRNTSKIFTELR